MENAPTDFPKFRYRAQMERLSAPCPPEDFAPKETVAFRWVFDGMDDERNFLPQFIKDPSRFEFDKDAVKCQGLGLSFFDTRENAILQFEKLKRRMMERAYGLGTNLAEGVLPEESGVSGLPGKDGHFTFHPYENQALKEYFQIVASLSS